MTNLYTGYDAFFYPRRLGSPLDATTAGLRVIDSSGTEQTAFIDDNLYTTIGWTFHGTEHLFDELRNKVSPLIGSTFFERVDLVGADGKTLKDWGTRMRTNAGSFSVDTDNAQSEGVLRMLGFPVGVGEIHSTFDGLNHVIDSPTPTGGCWRSPVHSQSKISNHVHEQYVSGGRGMQPQLTRWGSDQIRRFEYKEVPSGHVREGRTEIESFARAASLPVGSSTNSFADFWNYGISRFAPIFAMYHLDMEEGIPDDFDFIDDREILMSAHDSREVDDLNQCLSRSRRSAEHYSVEFDLKVLESFWKQG